jgi:hypothetical protein
MQERSKGVSVSFQLEPIEEDKQSKRNALWKGQLNDPVAVS